MPSLAAHSPPTKTFAVLSIIILVALQLYLSQSYAIQIETWIIWLTKVWYMIWSWSWNLTFFIMNEIYGMITIFNNSLVSWWASEWYGDGSAHCCSLGLLYTIWVYSLMALCWLWHALTRSQSPLLNAVPIKASWDAVVEMRSQLCGLHTGYSHSHSINPNEFVLGTWWISLFVYNAENRIYYAGMEIPSRCERGFISGQFQRFDSIMKNAWNFNRNSEYSRMKMYRWRNKFSRS